jgi:hypothetical protein
MAIVRCTAETCRHNSGYYCTAESINLQDKDYFDAEGKPLDDDMVCITYNRLTKKNIPLGWADTWKED